MLHEALKYPLECVTKKLERKKDQLSKRAGLACFVVFFIFLGIIRVTWMEIEFLPSFQVYLEVKDTSNAALDSIEVHRPDFTKFRNMKGSWIGNTWIPPVGWKLYSASELREFYKNTSMLWVGDSTCRRTYATFYGILNSTQENVNVPQVDDESVIDINRHSSTELCPFWSNNNPPVNLCRPNPAQLPKNDRTQMVLISVPSWETPCLGGIHKFMLNELAAEMNTTDDYASTTTQANLIVIGIGIWDAAVERTCAPLLLEGSFRSTLNATMTLMNQFLHLRSQRNKSVTIIWRTSGFSKPLFTPKALEVNAAIMSHIDIFNSKKDLWCRENKSKSEFYCNHCHQTYVNWGGAIEPRSAIPERISGDVAAHYGLEPRLVLIQMITNALAELGY